MDGNIKRKTLTFYGCGYSYGSEIKSDTFWTSFNIYIFF